MDKIDAVRWNEQKHKLEFHACWQEDDDETWEPMKNIWNTTALQMFLRENLVECNKKKADGTSSNKKKTETTSETMEEIFERMYEKKRVSCALIFSI